MNRASDNAVKSSQPRASSRPRIRPLFFLFLLAHCGLFRELGFNIDEPEWLTERYTDVSKSDIMSLVAAEVSREYRIQAEDQGEGRIGTAWLYGDFDRRTHRSLRERVLVEISRAKEDTVEIRLRVQRQQNDELGRYANPNTGDWNYYPDNVIQAQVLMKRIHAILRDPDQTASDTGS